MSASLLLRDLIDIDDLTPEEISEIFSLASLLAENPAPRLLEGKILASCFFEPSTRTRTSFEAAMLRLGGSVLNFSDEERSSRKKGETLADTFRMIANVADIAVIRHPLEGTAELAAKAASIPIINGGDGANAHPTQALVDLWAIQKSQKKLENNHIAFLGDLKHSRSVRSLIKGLLPFHPRLYLISPPELEISDDLFDLLKENSIKFSFHKTLAECLPKLDILYVTRLQKERHEKQALSLEPDAALRLKDLTGAKENFKILHPLPRVGEIDEEVDHHPAAYYFTQAKGGILIRQALLCLMLGRVP